MSSKLGILTDEVSPSLRDALAFAKANQFGHVEIRTVDGANAIGLSDVQLTSIRKQVEAHGLVVSCFASPVFKCALSPDRVVASGDSFGVDAGDVDAHFGLLRKSFDVAKALGTDRIRVFSFWRERNPVEHHEEIVGHLRIAARMAEQAGLLLLLENEPACNGGFGEEVAHLVTSVQSPALKVLWDPGNEVYGGRSAMPHGYKAVRDVVGHVHLKDAVVIDGHPSCVPIGLGAVSFHDQLRALHHDGYAGLYTIETHYVPPGGTAQDGSALSLLGLRRVEQESGLSFGGH